MTIKISQLGNLTAVLGNVIIPVVSNVAGTLTTVKGNVDQIKTFVLGTIETDLTSLTANAAAQAGSIAILTANAAVQAGLIADVSTSVTTANTAMKGYVDGQVTTLTANAAVQAGLIADLSANAAIQAGLIASAANVSGITANVTTLQNNVVTLTANAATQSGAIASITNGTATFGNILPSANVTYSLGSPTAQWKDLYLSGTTIYIGGATISVSNTAIATSLPLESSGTFTSDDISVTGNINATSATVTGEINLGLSGKIFDANITGTYNTTVILAPISGSAALAAATASNIQLQNSFEVHDTHATVNIFTANVAQPNVWEFRDTSSLLLPGGSELVDADGNVMLSGGPSGSSSITALNTNIANIGGVAHSVVVEQNGVNVILGDEYSANVSYIWAYRSVGNVGVISFPDNTNQQTAYTATFANATPSSANDTGTKGDIVYDASYIYICVDTNTWIRSARVAW